MKTPPVFREEFYFCDMRYITAFLLIPFLFFSCKSADSDNPEDILPGNWFVLYPEEELQTRKQEEVYAATQDSLTDLKCLKLIRFSEKGTFNQQDSISITGTWNMKEANVIQVAGGGEGFDRFHTRFTSYKDGVLKLTELAEARGEKLKLVWHLLRIEKGGATALFDKEKNKWRIKAVKEESDNEIRERLIQMLEYYAVYFQLIADESSYFMPSRVILPFKFYQHGIGLKTFDRESKFAQLFYSTEQAQFAGFVLKGAIERASFDYKDNSSYSKEYVKMLEELAREVRKQLVVGS